jgi:hypothetical protein
VGSNSFSPWAPQARASASASAAGRRNDSNYRPTAYSPGYYYSSQLHPDSRLMLMLILRLEMGWKQIELVVR